MYIDNFNLSSIVAQYSVALLAHYSVVLLQTTLYRFLRNSEANASELLEYFNKC